MLPGRGCGQPDDSGELENMVKIQGKVWGGHCRILLPPVPSVT